MVNVFGEGSRAGDLDLKTTKRVVEENGKYQDWVKEIDESHRVGFPPYRIFTDGTGTFMSPIRVYDRKVYVLTDIAVLDVGDRTIKGDGKLVYFCFADDDDVAFAVQGDRGPVGGQGEHGREVQMELLAKLAREVQIDQWVLLARLERQDRRVTKVLSALQD